MKLKIRDGHATINGDKTEYEMPSGSMDIIGEDGKTLFDLAIEDGQLRVSAGTVIKYEGFVLDDQIAVRPSATNVVYVFRLPYE